jgi:hypothetical protein
MKKLHIILLEEPGKAGTPEDTLTVYVARHGSQNEALLRMHMQGILPKYNVVSHSSGPALKTLIGMWFPSIGIIQNLYGKVNLWTMIKFHIGRPLSKLFTGSTRKRWMDIGEYDVKTRRVYPVPDGERLSE